MSREDDQYLTPSGREFLRRQQLDAEMLHVPLPVWELFISYAWQVRRAGYDRYSSDAILHRIRWHERIDRKNREFKANNNWTAPMARFFMDKYPMTRGFFELRVRKSQIIRLGEYDE